MAGHYTTTAAAGKAKAVRQGGGAWRLQNGLALRHGSRYKRGTSARRPAGNMVVVRQGAIAGQAAGQARKSEAFTRIHIWQASWH
jgi:hypothetical protein